MSRVYPTGRKMPQDWKMGTRNSMAKIDWLAAAEIRGAPAGYGRIKALRLKFGLSEAHIRRIRRGEHWTLSNIPTRGGEQ